MSWPKGMRHARYIDGRTSHPLHSIWNAMIRRCTVPGDRHYEDYGGRGIQVCDRWRNSFWDFIEDVGERPEGMTLDRIDNDGNYEPGNVRWATRSDQQRNQRRKQHPGLCKRGHQLTNSGIGCLECNRMHKRNYNRRCRIAQLTELGRLSEAEQLRRAIES